MAYGKIKADAIVYDNSGSDVEVTTSSIVSKANLASPAFTGTPTAPTASTGTNNTQIATTAYVIANSNLVKVTQATYSTRVGLANASNSRVTMWNFSITKERSNSKFRVHVMLPLGGSGDSYPHFATTFIRFSTGNYGSNGSDIFGYIHNTRATSNNMGANLIGDFLYDTSGTNISGTGTIYCTIGYHPAQGGMRPSIIWNPNSNEDNRSRQSISTVVIEEITA
jgi:hypothetical protein|tara:strand:+ start:13 stop:684 length:672 start_codon:yes stop_codon:yes gene_type:complete